MRPRRLAYGSDASQFGELHLPVTAHPPVVVLLHGGFWSMPYGMDQMTPLAKDLARRGFAAWNLEYRRLGGGGGWPATLLDVSMGIDHLATLGAELDLSRVAAVGHSAGGHLALWAAGRHHAAEVEPLFRPKVRVTAAVGQAPVADLARGHALGLGRGVVDRLLGGAPEAVAKRYAAASPAQLLPLGVPQLLVQGGADDIVPPEISRGYAAAARNAGDEVEYRELPGADHFVHLDVHGPAWGAVVAWLEKTLKAQ